jgi:hypothetical protein
MTALASGWLPLGPRGFIPTCDFHRTREMIVQLAAFTRKERYNRLSGDQKRKKELSPSPGKTRVDAESSE